MNILKSKKGSATIEAAIFLPIFIIAIISIAFIMKIFQAQAYTENRLDNETRRVALEAYGIAKAGATVVELIKPSSTERIIDLKKLGKELYTVDPLGVKRFVGTSVIEARINENLDSKVKNNYNIVGNVTVESSKYDIKETANARANNIEIDKLIDVTMAYSIESPFSLRLFSDVHISQRVIARQWTGTDQIENPLSFEEMQNEKNANEVFIFTKAGEKYHAEDCRFVKSVATKMPLTSEMLDEYEICSYCDEVGLFIGEQVYMFKNGDKIHRENCFLIDKEIKGLSKEIAIEKGYEPCKECQ